MYRYCFTLLLFLFFFISKAQTPVSTKERVKTEKDTIKKKEFLNQIGNGYFPLKYFNIDLRYLVKFNQYEGFRTGLGGITNKTFSKKLRLNTYVVYGFRDHTFKYSFGAGYKIAQKTNTWINASYTDDLQETGSTQFLTDKRTFQFFEPRLLNIELFYKHITKTISLEHEITPKLISEIEFAHSDIDPTFNYEFVINNKAYHTFHISTAKIALRWSPSDIYETLVDNVRLIKNAYPKFTLQYTKSFSDILNSDFNFSKIDFKAIHKIDYRNNASTQLLLTSGVAIGETPLTHLYHAYPNNNTKETIMQRFSVAGINSFETMFFNEFFSDKFVILQFKQALSPFKISKKFKPQLVLISRFVLGDMSHIERHQSFSFSTLDKGYTESGFEINKLLFGFGLSFAYRYGAYHLPEIEDNIAFKFTFNITL
ncbi:MAG: hypothetical protein IMY67_06455 [Bacteroidetes bacterium]|nr:hypothetical protein [Bacteroidota bacterium]